MTPRLIFFLLISCALCKGQAVLTDPVEPPLAAQSEQAPGDPGAPAADTTFPALAQRPPLDRPSAADSALTPTARNAAATRSTEPRRVVMPPLEKTDFQLFAEDATGRSLPVFGRQLFEEVPTTFAPLERMPVPATYVLGPGDELLIRAWGKIDLDARVTIDRNGQIALPRVGVVTVAGLRFEQAESYLHAAISALYKDFELNVALGQLRSIQVFVLGSARRPGVYTVSSLSTLVNAVFASGGPGSTGSMRHIELRRKGSPVTTFDLYDLAEKGDQSHDMPLLPGDVIFFAAIGPQVGLSGSVNQPGIYELNGETTIAQALAAAGGLTSLAGSARALLERIDDRSTRRVDQFSLDRAGLNRTLKDGDLLRIFPVSPKFENAVLLQGNVAEPGRYEWKEGMRVSDLIPSRVALVTRAYWQQHNRTPDEAGGREKPAISTRTRLAGAQNAAERPEDGTGDRPDAAEEPTALERIADLNAEINWEYAVIERLDEHDLSTRLISFRLGNAIDEPESVDNQLLKAGDIVTIFSRADLPLPMEKHATFVSVNGEVNAPGLYRVAPGETLRDVVARAGGLTPHSYLYASLLTRISVRHAQQEELRQAAEKMQRELVSHYASSMPQNGQSTGDQQSQLSLQQAAIGRLAAVPVSGRVVLDMKPEAGTLDDIPAVALEDGDSFFIPPRLSTVQVTGAVYNANAFRQETGKRLIAYLNDAGGATRDADRKHIYVLRADGTVVNAESGERHRHGGLDAMLLLPGDAIVVPEKLAGSSKLNTFMQAAQFASQTAVTAAALSVIR